MEPEWIAAATSVATLWFAVLAWHNTSVLVERIEELKRALNGRWHESIDTAGRENRAIGIQQGVRNERADHAQRMEKVRIDGVLVTELPSQERRADDPS